MTVSLSCFSLSFFSLQKERDLELAARIGQSLLKKNKSLTERNELLEEQVEHIREEVRVFIDAWCSQNHLFLYTKHLES